MKRDAVNKDYRLNIDKVAYYGFELGLSLGYG
jgi:hypothetical protein